VCEHKLAHRSHTTSDKTRKAKPALEKKDEGKGVHKVKRVDAAHIERVCVGRKQGAGGRAQTAESVNTLVRTQVCVCVCVYLPPHTHSHWACRASSARVITALALRVKQRTEQKHVAKEDKANIVTAWWVGGEVVCVACGLGDPHSPCRWGGHKDRRIVHAWRHCRGGGIHSPLQSRTRARRGPSAHRSKSPHGDPLTTRHTREAGPCRGVLRLRAHNFLRE
jgi:hypothetical protein